MSRRVLLALALCGCNELYLDVDGISTPLGVGLEADYQSVKVTCTPNHDTPEECWHDPVPIARLRSRGDLEVTRDPESSSRFFAFGLAAGTGEIAIDTEVASGVFEIAVEPITYTALRWLDVSARRDWLHANSLQMEQFGRAFADSVLGLDQVHYRKTRAELDAFRATNDGQSSRSEAGLHLRGTTPWKLDRRATRASVEEGVFEIRPGYQRPIGVLRTGSVLGPIRITTHAGGELEVDIVDTREIRGLTILDIELARPAQIERDSYLLDWFELVPIAADGGLIAGCPTAGPELFDERGMFTITRKAEQSSPFCAFDFALVPDQVWQDTTLVARWNGVELRVPIVGGF